MANDRIYIRCKGCGEEFFLGKSFGGGFYYPRTDEDLAKMLNEFYDAHTFCQGADEGDYEIVYESEKEKPKVKTIGPCKVCIITPDWCPLMKES